MNWVFFRESDDFDEAFQSLHRAIDTDLEWVSVHTRLLVCAREWDNERRNKSFTLRGRDLREAEEWLAKGTEKEPKPTGLQTQYVITSRKAATKRQTITLTSVLCRHVNRFQANLSLISFLSKKNFMIILLKYSLILSRLSKGMKTKFPSSSNPPSKTIA